MRKTIITAPPGAGEHGPRSRQHTAWWQWDITEREKETDDDDGPANSLAVMQEAATRQNKLATERQIAPMSGSTRRMPVYQGVGPCLGTLRDPNSPTNSPDGAENQRRSAGRLDPEWSRTVGM